MMTTASLDANERDAASEARLQAELSGPVLAFRSLPSTMDAGHALAERGGAHGTLIWTARQSAGRGRLGRAWVSPAGGIYFSLLLRPNRPALEIPQLSLVAGLAGAEAIHELTGLTPAIRWPNDLLLNDRKVSGILVEQRAGATILGVGVNIDTQTCDLPEKATSLAVAGASCDPLRLTTVFVRRFSSWYDAWMANGFAVIRTPLRSWLGLFGHPVQLTMGSRHVQGTAHDVDDAGRLLVRLDSGVVQSFDVGEVSLLRQVDAP